MERFVAELDAIKPKPKEQPQQVGQSAIPQWIASPTGFMKINVDAAISKNTSIAALADNSDVFLGVSALVMPGVTDAEIAEGLACGEGMTLANNLLMQKFILASYL